MSSAEITAVPRSESTTVRQFLRAVGLALLAVGVGCCLYMLEKYLIHPEQRFVENPIAVMMRSCGLAHFWIGWLFLFTSPRLRSRAALGRLAVLTLFGAALCIGCALSGAARNPFVFLFFYGYFLLHEVRDQATLFQAYKDAPADRLEEQDFLAALTWAASMFLLTVLTFGFSLHEILIGKIAAGTPAAQAFLAGGLIVLLTANAWTAARALRLGCRLHGDVPSLVAAYRPLLMIYGFIFALLLFGAVCGSVVFNLIILIHAAAWFLFVHAQLRKRPAPARRNPWTWLRGTPAGFAVLHAGVVVLILMLLGVRVYVWQRVGFLSELLATSSFSYWSLMHISMSFWRGR